MKSVKLLSLVLVSVLLLSFNLKENGLSTINDENQDHFHPEYSDVFTKQQLAPELKPGLLLYVSPNGNNRNDGSKDSPFLTLEEARNAIRELKKSEGLPEGGIHVIVEAGTYNFENALELTEQDAGTKKSPIVYKGAEKGAVILSAGVPLDTKGMTIVEDPEQLLGLNQKARGNVMSIDLTETNLDKYFPGEGKYGDIAMNGHMLQLAQWPNRGYHHIDEIIECGPTTRWLKPGEKPMEYSKENPTGGKFTFKEKLSEVIEQEFQRSGDMRAQGYFHNDWYFQDEPVGDISNGTVQLLHHTRYGIVKKIKSVPRRVRLLNVLSELDEPGEWYYDKKNQQLYVWPITGFVPGESNLTIIGSTKISANLSYKQPGERNNNLQPSIVRLQNTSYITFRDFVVENTANVAAYIDGGEYNLLAGNVFRNGAGEGVIIQGGKHNGITGCDFYDLYSAFTISGGDFKTLDWSYHFATNNLIRNCRLRGYGVVSLSGVGIHFAHNLLHTMNGAVMYRTVNLLMEYNEYYNIGYEMGDFNVAYCGAQWYTMNNVLRYNFVHHIIEPGGHPITAFRNDDNGAGMKVYGNVFYRPGRAGVIFHGFLNNFQNNITMDCNFMWWTLKKPIDSSGIQARWDGLAKFGRDLPKGDKGDYIYIMEQVIGKNAWKKGIWKETFPELEAAIDKNPWAQTGCAVNNNYGYKIKSAFHIHGGDGTVEGLESTYTGKFDDLPQDEVFEFPKEINYEAFVDVESLDFRFKKGFELMEGFNPIPFEEIGLEKDQYRLNPPLKQEYRKQVFQKFKEDKGGRYNAEVVNARYPVPAYLEK